MLLKDLAKQLYAMFENGEIDTSNLDFTGIKIHGPETKSDVFTDDAIIDILMSEIDDTDDTDDTDDMLYSNLAGHWNESTMWDYLDATDEDGNWLHPYDKEY